MKKLLKPCALLALLLPALVCAQNLVTDVKIGKSIVDRQIADETTAFALGEKAYLWIRAEGGTGETLTVTWTSGGQSFPVTLNIGGNPWRTWANKTLHLAGEWTVTVTDAAGATLSETKLSVQ